MLRQDILFDLPTFSMISERVKTCHMECHDIADFFYLFCKFTLRKKFTLQKIERSSISIFN